MAKKIALRRKKWIQGAVEREGRIRRLLGKKEGEKITVAELDALEARLRRQGKLDRSLSSAITLARRFVSGEFRRQRKKS